MHCILLFVRVPGPVVSQSKTSCACDDEQPHRAHYGTAKQRSEKTPGATRMCKSPAVALKLTDSLISHPFRGVLGLIPFPKVVKYSINSYFDVLLDNTFKVEQKVKFHQGCPQTA